MTRHAGLRLDVDRDVRHAVLLLKDDLELVRNARNLLERLLDLTRIEVDALHDQHVIRPSRDAVDAERGPSARALLAREYARDVVRAVADDRHGLARKGREDDLAVFAVRNDLAGRRIDDLGDVLVFPDMQAAVGLAVLSGRADATRLGHAIDVKALNAEARLLVSSEKVSEPKMPTLRYGRSRSPSGHLSSISMSRGT